MSGLRKRTLLFPHSFDGRHPIMRGFHAKQRDHAPKVQHPKPEAS